jgi:hypothetical protein
MVTPFMDWTLFWSAASAIGTGVAAVGTVGAFAFLIYQQVQLRHERHDALIPFLAMELPSDAVSINPIPVRVSAYGGGGDASNVIINLQQLQTLVDGAGRQLPVQIRHIGTGVIRSVHEGLPQDTNLPGNLSSPFGGILDLHFTDVFGLGHHAMQGVNCASGPLKTTDILRWGCVKCRKHPRAVQPVG